MVFNKRNKKAVPPIYNYENHNIPKKLQKQPYWGVWKWQWKKKQWTKVPLNDQGKRIDVRFFSLTFKQAVKLQKEVNGSGIGYYFSPENDQLGLDFDDCFSNGKLHKEIRKITKKLNPAYTEKSVSGNGLHIVGSGAKHINGVDESIVFYKSRFFTFTGSGSGEIVNIGKKVNKLFKRKRKTSKSSDNQGILDISELYNVIPSIAPNLPEPKWYEVCKAIHAKSGGSKQGWILFNSWSRGDMCGERFHYRDYDENDCRDKWDRCSLDKPELLGMPTLRDIAAQYPVRAKIDIQLFKQKSFELISPDLHKNLLQLNHFPKSDALTAAREISRYTCVPVDPILTTMLVVYSAAMNKKIVIQEKVGLEHHCSLGALISMKSGGRKSTIDRSIMFPFKAWEADKVDEWKKKRFEYKAREKALSMKLKELHARLSEDYDNDTLITQVADIEQEKAKLKIKMPKFIEGDITEEKLSESLSSNKEVMLIQSDDARNILRNITGRYDTTGETIYICGLTGDSYRRSRIKDDTDIVLNSPCINLSLKVQPDMLETFVESRSLLISGLMARIFLKSIDTSLADQMENNDIPELDKGLLSGYNLGVRRILEYDGPRIRVKLTQEAKEYYIDYSKQIAKHMRTGGKWFEFDAVTNKITTLMCKIAVVLKAMKNPNFMHETQEGEFSLPQDFITLKEITLSSKITEILINQSVEVVNGFEADMEISGAKKLLEKLLDDKEKRDIESWSWTDLRNKYSANARGNLERWIGVLVENNILIRTGNEYEFNVEVKEDE